MIVNIISNVTSCQSLLLGFYEIALHLTVQTVSHPLQHDIGVAIDTGMLSLGGNLLKDLVNIGHIEVTTQTEILRLPVVSAQEGMHIGQTALARGGIAQVTHIQLTGKIAIDF